MGIRTLSTAEIREQRKALYRPEPDPDLWIAALWPKNGENLGTLLRTCDAVGAGGCFVGGVFPVKVGPGDLSFRSGAADRRRETPMTKWKDPPPMRRDRSRKWYGLLEPLMAEPNRWALIAEDVPLTAAEEVAARLRGRRIGRGVIVPPGRWDATVRRRHSKTADLYARYLGASLGEDT